MPRIHAARPKNEVMISNLCNFLAVILIKSIHAVTTSPKLMENSKSIELFGGYV